MNQSNDASTTTKMIPVSRPISLYASLMRPAFGECGVSGAKPPFPACATAASASAAPSMSTRTMSLLRTGACDSYRVEAFTRVQLPAGVGDRYEGYVNGIKQEPGRDFDRIGETLVF